MEGDTFYDWFKNMFLENIPEARPVLLIFDGHASHITLPLIKLALSNKVTVLRLPSHTTHYLQPLDVGVYGPVKTAWEKILVKYARQHLGRALTKDEFPRLVKDLWDTVKPESLRSGFRSCGIVPLDPSVIPESRYEASIALKTRQPPTAESSTSDNQSDASQVGPTTPASNLGSSTSVSVRDSAEHDVPSTSRGIADQQIPVAPAGSYSCPFPATTDSTDDSIQSETPSSVTSDSSAPAIKEFFAKHIQIAAHSNRPRKRPSERVKRLKYGESLTGEECIRRMEKEDRERDGRRKRKLRKRHNRRRGSNRNNKASRVQRASPRNELLFLMMRTVIQMMYHCKL